MISYNIIDMRHLLKKISLIGLVVGWLSLTTLSPAMASEGQVLGIHILHPYELPDATKLIKTETNQDKWHFVTIPLSLDDLNNPGEWQKFFNEAKKQKLIPVVRLVTRFENGSWQIPTRKNIVDQATFLSKLEWPTDDRYIIVFNEVNHAKEWGGTIDPTQYSQVLRFTSDWFKTEQHKYVVLPAAMDLAAPNGSETMEAFRYLNQMYTADNDIFKTIDIWNSHSYPNPGFSSSPQRTAQNSLRGFEHELRFLEDKTDQELKVLITETGWVNTRQTTRWLESYYDYAIKHIWSDPRVIGVTPFVLRGDPGPFSEFAFLDRNNQPTAQYTAFRNALERAEQDS